MEAEQIRRFYMNWRELPVHCGWPFLWKKEVRLETQGGEFLCVNRLRSRLNFRVLKELCIKLLPVHVYMSALNFARPWMVSSKTKTYKAYPFRTGEFVVDIDSYLAYKPHSHRTRNNEPCHGCIQNAYDLTLKVLKTI